MYRVILPAHGGNNVGYVKADLRLRHRFPGDAPLEILRDGVPLEDGQPLQDGASLELRLPSGVSDMLRSTVAPVTYSSRLASRMPVPTRSGGRSARGGGSRGGGLFSCACGAPSEGRGGAERRGNRRGGPASRHGSHGNQ